MSDDKYTLELVVQMIDPIRTSLSTLTDRSGTLNTKLDHLTEQTHNLELSIQKKDAEFRGCLDGLKADIAGLKDTGTPWYQRKWVLILMAGGLSGGVGGAAWLARALSEVLSAMAKTKGM